jgi:hypothetical protein
MILLSLGVCTLVGTPLYSYFDQNHIKVDVVPLSNTSVEFGEDVLFQVTLQNNYDSAARIDLWFTVDLTGVDQEKLVSTPYLSKVSPIGGVIPASEEVILKLKARPLENVPGGPYTFYAKAGTHSTDFIKSEDRFQGVILLSNVKETGPDYEDEWILSSIWAVNEAGRTFLAGSGRSIPKSIEMIQNYPNPFNPSTSISYVVKPMDGFSVPVELTIYDVRGRLVRTLMNGKQSAGLYTIKWDGKNDRGMTLDSGVYIFRIRSGEDVSIRKGVLTK